MKIKNINIAERHLEKVIVGLCALAAIYFLYVYAISGSYQVTVNNATKSPNELEAEIRNASTSLKRALETAPVPDLLQNLEVAPYAQNFRERFERPILADVFSYETPIGLPGLEPKIVGNGPAVQSRNYAVTVPPPPTGIRTRADFAKLTVSPDSRHYEELTNIVGQSEPYDFWYVSVQAQFDMGLWRRRQNSEPPGVAVPQDWARDSSYVVDVTLERQTWNGSWEVPVEVIRTIPGNLSFRAVPANPVRSMVDEWIEQIRLQQDTLTKPPFAPVSTIRPWLPPDVVGQLTSAQIVRLREIASEQARIRQQLDNGAAPAPRGPVTGGGPGGGFVGVDSEDMSPAARRTVGIGRGVVAPDQPAAVSENDLIAQLQALNQEYIELVGGRPAEPVDPRDQLAALDDVKVWQHDITVKPGMSYRYRIIVNVINPLFQRNQLSLEQRRAQFDKLARASEPSAWTEPVTIPTNKQFFVSGAVPGNKGASVEVWTVFDGAWRQNTFSVQPGDPIGNVVEVKGSTMSANVDLNVDATVVDIDYAYPVASQPNATTTRVLYMDDNTGELYWQTAFSDASSPQRRALQAN